MPVRLRFFPVICILLFSCKKDLSGRIALTDSVSDFDQAFNAFWSGVSTNYVYWDIDTTNWDSKYSEYKPLFNQLDWQDSIDREKAIAYLTAMTHTLIDGHFYITFSSPFPSGVTLYPAAVRKQGSLTFHYPFSYMDLDTNYFDPGYQMGRDSINGFNGQALRVDLGMIDSNILFFSCNEFSLLNSYESPVANTVQPILRRLFSMLDSLPANIAGIIIDVRDNNGGNLGDLDLLLGPLTDADLALGYTRYKSGSGRLDYTPWIKAVIPAKGNGQAGKLPVVVLADNYSISLAEAVTMAVHALPHGVFVGETTWGATGPLVEHNLYNDGQFSIAGFLNVYTSSCEFRYIDGKSYEGNGFPPDVSVPFSSQAISDGRDIQLEKAISLIEK